MRLPTAAYSKKDRGMGSIGAMLGGSSDRYFQNVEDGIKKTGTEGTQWDGCHLSAALTKRYTNIRQPTVHTCVTHLPQNISAQLSSP